MKIMVVSAMALCLGGCQTLRPNNWGENLNPDPLAIPQSWAPSSAGGTVRSRALAYSLIQTSDTRCADYMVGVSAQRNSVNAGMTIGSLALGSVAALVAPSASANAFAAGSTFLQSSNRTLNDTVFSGREFWLIMDAVNHGRDRERDLLFTQIEATPWASLIDEAVLTRVAVYDAYCGVNYGMTELQRAVSSPET